MTLIGVVSTSRANGSLRENTAPKDAAMSSTDASLRRSGKVNTTSGQCSWETRFSLTAA
jgi:hypothetical protein